ncbi:hypothetical protein B0T14DRAFT_211877 [Immersiella caudata]|uniref:Uncharacterized protein n=1 Tax=Immersiella caudata TaxID=314043 RepID=A0AA39WQL8_9PEZI|nr:hypothetical protein B0T14DRAFT_211877 [Immersiella caudata]
MPPIDVDGGNGIGRSPLGGAGEQSQNTASKDAGRGGCGRNMTVAGHDWRAMAALADLATLGSSGFGDSGGHRPGGFGSWRLGIGYGGRPASKIGPPDDEKGGGAKMQGQLSRLWSARRQDGKGQVLWIGTCDVPHNVLCELRTPTVPEAETSEAGRAGNERSQRPNISHDACLFR